VDQYVRAHLGYGHVVYRAVDINAPSVVVKNMLIANDAIESAKKIK
jgi:hypothetical protein